MGRPKGSKNKVPWALRKAEIERRREEDARDPDLVAIREFLEHEESTSERLRLENIRHLDSLDSDLRTGRNIACLVRSLGSHAI